MKILISKLVFASFIAVFMSTAAIATPHHDQGDSLDNSCIKIQGSQKLQSFVVGLSRKSHQLVNPGVDTDGTSLGDIIVSKGMLLSLTDTNLQVGSYIARRITVDVNTDTSTTDDIMMEFVMGAPRIGTIIAQNWYKSPPGSVAAGRRDYAVIGGTGCWAGAKGVVVEEDISTTNSSISRSVRFVFN